MNNQCNCTISGDNLSPLNENMFSEPMMPTRRYLEPVLVAKIYNQPIVEELPYSAMTMTVDTNTTVNAYTNPRPMMALNEMNAFNNTCNSCNFNTLNY